MTETRQCEKRTLRQLSEGARQRIRDYVFANADTVPTEELSEELYLRPGTIAAIKAHITMRRDAE